jgi:hypothetical protein
MLCPPPPGHGGVANANYPPLASLRLSPSLSDAMECNPSLLEFESLPDAELVWDADYPVSLVISTTLLLDLLFVVPFLGGVLTGTVDPLSVQVSL